MSKENAIALVDCNNFYASCERVVNPALLARPVVVLSHNDGMIISRSDEVKAMGVPMAAPLFQYREHRGNDSYHAVGRDTLGLGKPFSKSVRFL